MEKSIPFSKLKRILVCKLRHHGDVLLSSPVFSTLRRVSPHAKIDAYIYAETQPMLEGHPAIERFHLYEKKWKKEGLIKRYGCEARLLKAIYQSQYDLVINLTEGDRGALAAWISRARYRVAFDPKGQGMWGKNHCYTHLVRECPTMRHTVEMNLDVLRGVGLFPRMEDKELTLAIPQQSKAAVQSYIKKPFAIVHPVSRWMFKCAKESLIAKAIDYIMQKGIRVYLTASNDPVEKAYNARVKQLVKGDVIDLSGQLGLKELAALIQEAQLLLSVDSVPMHMASALKTPTVALFGPTSEVRWAPWNNPRVAIVKQNLSCRPCYRPGCADSHHSECLLTLSSDEVCKAIDTIM